MARKRQLGTQLLYGVSQVAAILRIPAWRVKNFTEGKEYRLPPAIHVGSGRGSRRLYAWEDIFRIGLANRLVKYGFTAEVVGRAVREVPESVFEPYKASVPYRHLLLGRPLGVGTYVRHRETHMLVGVLLADHMHWRVMKASELNLELVKQSPKRERSLVPEELFVLNLTNFCDSVFERLQRYHQVGIPRTEEE